MYDKQTFPNKQTSPTNFFEPNPFGLYDILGNIWEWTGSIYEAPYQGKEQHCVTRDEMGLRVIRGGAWDIEPKLIRASYRGKYLPDARGNDVGFRLIRLLIS